MAQLVLGAAGAVVGGMVSGWNPYAMQAGWAIGSALGSVMFPNKQKGQQQQLMDLKVVGTEYGQPIPWVQGHALIAGQIWWNTDRRATTTTTTSGGKGGGSKVENTTITYDMDVLIGLTDCEIDGVSRIWNNGKLVYTNLASATYASITASAATEAWTRLTVYTGSSSQLPDPTYEAAVGTANAPAYRGRSYVFIQGLQLGQSGILPNLTFEVSTNSTLTEAGVFEPSSGPVKATGDATTVSCTVTNTVAGRSLVACVQWFSNVTTITSITCTGESNLTLLDSPSSSINGPTSIQFAALPILSSGGDKTLTVTMSADSFRVFIFAFEVNGGDTSDFYNVGSSRLVQQPGDPAEADPTGNITTTKADCLIVGYVNNTNGPPNPPGTPTTAGSGWTGYATSFFYNDAAEYKQVIGDAGVISVPFVNAVPGYFLMKMAAFNMLTTPQATSVLLNETLDNVVSRLLLRAGLSASQFDVTDLASITNVRSIAVSQVTSTRSVLDLLMTAYFFEMVVSDKIYFRKRGVASVASIPWLDLGTGQGNDQPEPLALKQVNDLEIPAQIALTYINVSDDYQTDTQYSDRLVSSVAGTLGSVQMAIGLTPAEAKSIVDTMLFDQSTSSIGTNLALLGEYCRLEPTDVVTVADSAGTNYTFRLVKKTDSFPLLSFEAVLEDATVLTSQGSTSTDYAPQTVVAAAVDTSMKLMDIPILRDIDNDEGFYVAAKGDSTPYPGSAIFNSADDVEYTRLTTVLESAVFGTCTTTLGDWTGTRVFDECNTVTVNVGSGTLSSSTRSAVLNNFAVNAMLIGSELIQFRTVTLVSAGVYILSGLLRGGRGTEWAMTGHAASERCVLLQTTGLRRIVLTNAELGVSRYYKGVTLGRALSTATAESFTNTAIGLKPFAPFDLRVWRDISNNIVATWQRRSRLSVRSIGSLGISVPIGEETESYDIEVYSDGTYTTVVRTATLSSPTATYTAAEQTADGLTPGNTIYVKIYQRSTVVGRGYALTKAV